MSNIRFGIPYAKSTVMSNGRGRRPHVVRECPVCGLEISEAVNSYGELATNNYGKHYEEEHGE